MPTKGLIRYTTNHKHAQENLDRANDMFLDLRVGEASQIMNYDRVLDALMAAWDFITDTTDQEIYYG